MKQISFKALALFCSVYAVFAWAQPPAGEASRPRNIIILFADGAAGTQWEFGRYASQLLLARPFAVTQTVLGQGALGLMSTESFGSFVTDSAAAATAMSTGEKVKNGAIAMSPDGRILPTLMLAARRAAKKIGLVSTGAIYDASPAAMLVHANSRKESENIVNQYLALQPDVLMGGGADYFLPQTVSGGQRKDGRDLIKGFVQKNYEVARTSDELRRLDLTSDKRLLGLFAKEGMGFVLDGLGSEPSLVEMLNAALQKLTSEEGNGFILLVENENTDKAGHMNDAASLMHELWAFDAAVQRALAYQKQHPSTLVVVASDHETGGFSPTRFRAKDQAWLEIKPEQFRRLFSFKCSLETLAQRYKEQAGASQAELKKTLEHLIRENLPGIEPDVVLVEKILALRSDEPLSVPTILGLMIAQQTGFYWGTSGHTTEPVVVGALGPGADAFRGYQDNTDFARKIKRLIGESQGRRVRRLM